MQDFHGVINTKWSIARVAPVGREARRALAAVKRAARAASADGALCRLGAENNLARDPHALAIAVKGAWPLAPTWA
jgi:hypothetical protein